MSYRKLLKNSLIIYPYLVELRAHIDRYVPSSRRKHALTLQFFKQFVKAGGSCFDIGANNGSRTEIFIELGATVVCVEPQRTALAALHRRYRRNANVTIVDSGVGNEPGFAQLAICESADTLSTFSETWRTKSRFSGKYEWSRTELVRMTTLDLLIEQYGLPAFCKIDVEGFELTVLKGLSRPIPIILYEFSHELLDETYQSMAHLESIGPYEFNYSVGEEMSLASSRWVNASSCLERLKANSSTLLWGDIVARVRTT